MDAVSYPFESQSHLAPCMQSLILLHLGLWQELGVIRSVHPGDPRAKGYSNATNRLLSMQSDIELSK